MNIQTTPSIIKCQNSSDFLATLPVMMGYIVKNSIVISLFQGNRVSSSARFDLPQKDAPYASSGVEKAILAVLSPFKELRSVAIVLYTDESFATATLAPRYMLSKWLEKRLESSGYEVLENACVASDGWISYTEPYDPSIKKELTEIDNSMSGFEARSHLVDPLKRVEELATELEPDQELLRLITEALRDTSVSELTSSLEDNGAEDEGLANREFLAVAEQFFSLGLTVRNYRKSIKFAKSLDNGLQFILTIALLSYGIKATESLLGSLCKIEIALLQNLSDEKIFDEQSSWVERIQKFSMRRLDSKNLEKALENLNFLAAHLPDKTSSSLNTFIAWGWWMMGMVTPAVAHLERAKKSNQNNPIVKNIARLIEQGPPEWVYSQGSIKN